MTTYTQAINNHYNQINLGVNIFTALKRAGKDIKALTRDDIAPFDEFHIRGREATRELARLAESHNGLWSVEAEAYLLETSVNSNGPPL